MHYLQSCKTQTRRHRCWWKCCIQRWFLSREFQHCQLLVGYSQHRWWFQLQHKDVIYIFFIHRRVTIVSDNFWSALCMMCIYFVFITHSSTRGPRGPLVAQLRKNSKVTVEPIIENPRGII